MKDEIHGIMALVHSELQGMGTNLDGLQRTPDGDYIVPPAVMGAMVGAVQEILAAWRKAHSSMSVALASSLICREEALQAILEKLDDGTSH